MKKIIYTLLLAVISYSANAQLGYCGELFFSEYVEGTYDNKALEIYNPTDNPISLADYRIIRFSNGESDTAVLFLANEIMPLPSNATIAAKDVYVIVVNTTDVGTDTLPFADLASKADVQMCTSCDPNSQSLRTMCFNGDDAIGLQKKINNVWTNIDVIGLIGERPTNGAGGTSNPTGAWTAVPPYNKRDPNGSISVNAYYYYFWTEDHTMIRKPTITQGDDTVRVPNGTPGQWNPATQWDTLPENTFTNLGTHVCNCNNVGVGESVNGPVAMTIYPNPANTVVNIRLSENIRRVEVFNIAGQLVYALKPSEAVHITKFDTHGFTAGMYLIRVESDKGHVATKKVTIQ